MCGLVVTLLNPLFRNHWSYISLTLATDLWQSPVSLFAFLQITAASLQASQEVSGNPVCPCSYSYIMHAITKVEPFTIC